ncbi:hypothetical protein F5Y12DRAFT_271443 [Xylaria sp. FL1777]|nr:hypothetical protein F5Y12DRAFT_271443 [Xylaria sp. FL1777]
MAGPNDPPPNALVKIARKIYNPIGFTNGYNFVLWIIFLPVLLTFTLYRFQYLDFDGVFCSDIAKSKFNHAAPGECFYFKQQPYKSGIMIHLAGILPAALLACVQFMPFIRRRARRFHQINGKVVIFLSVVGTAGVFVILPRSFGGDVGAQIVGWMIGLAFLWALLMAYIGIKRRQIDLHRVWMLRAWFWAGCIITQRIIQIVLLKFYNDNPPYYTMPCDKIDFILKDRTLDLYPQCASFYAGENFQQKAAVRATLNHPTSAVEAAAALDVTFGISTFIAFALHLSGLELYLLLTSERPEPRRRIPYNCVDQTCMDPKNDPFLSSKYDTGARFRRV